MSFFSEINEFFTHGKINVNSYSIFYFKHLFCFSLLLKYLIEYSRKFPKHVTLGTYQYHYFIQIKKINKIFNWIYIHSFHLRLPLIILLLLNFETRILSFVLLISYISELFCLFRYHLIIICLVLFFIGIDNAYINSPNIFSFIFFQSHPILVSSIGLIFIKLLVIIVYLSSAFRKIQHKFYNGFIIKEGARFSIEASGRKFPDHFSALSVFISKNVLYRYSKGLSVSVIILEILVALCLLGPAPLSIVGIILGIILHIGMMMLFPITLSFFSLLMISILLLWQ